MVLSTVVMSLAIFTVWQLYAAVMDNLRGLLMGGLVCGIVYSKERTRRMVMPFIPVPAVYASVYIHIDVCMSKAGVGSATQRFT